MKKDKEFEEYLAKIEDPNYQREVNYDLPENATPLEATKYNICQEILWYKRKNSLTRSQIAQQIELSLPETEDILFCHIGKFTLDRLVEYASKLFKPLEVKIVKAKNKDKINFQTK